jgi:hypothetical protein
MSEVFDLICSQLKEMEPFESVTPFDLLGLPQPLRSVLNRAYRAGEVKLSELAAGFGLDHDEILLVVGMLEGKGLLRSDPAQAGEADPVFVTQYFGRMRGGTTHSV